jgi:hypothetical protein
MQHLDNHMDELFQKAAENYPLKTNPGNFDDLMPFIGGEAAVSSEKPVFSKGKRKTGLLLLGFIMMGLTVGTTYLFTNNKSTLTNNEKALVKENSNSPIQSSSSTEIKPDNATSVTALETTIALQEKTSSSLSTIYQNNKTASFTKGKMFVNIFSPEAVTAENIYDQPGNVTKKEKSVTTVKVVNPQQENDDIVTTEAKKEITDTPDKKEELISNEPKTTEKNNPKDKSKNKPSLYYGIAAGAELNEVKGQPMTKAGLTGGVILGVQLNPKTAIETGVQVSQKKYYSDGKYFKPKAGSMPANMLVNSLQSTSTVIEIPVAVKYNFSKKKNTVYAKAGVSSYIITKEANKYQAVVSGQQQEVNSIYKKNHSYFASDVRISAGYQHTVAKKINIRIEPFIQIPLKGIGVGNMPVTSTGLQLVLTRN